MQFGAKKMAGYDDFIESELSNIQKQTSVIPNDDGGDEMPAPSSVKKTEKLTLKPFDIKKGGAKSKPSFTSGGAAQRQPDYEEQTYGGGVEDSMGND